MAPKPPPAKAPDPKGKGQAQAQPQPSILDRAFPLWQDEPSNEKQPAAPVEKYEDVAGLVLPPETSMFLDTWKRPEELVLNAPDVPMVLTVAAAPSADGAAAGGAPEKAAGKKGAAPVVLSRELEGTLSAGHRTFEWLQAVFIMVISAQKTIKPGEYLWELIHPKDKDGQATRSPSGKYKVKLFIMDTWRTVVVDDRIPVDLFGRPLLVNARPIQLWPLLLSKAVLKVMAANRILHAGLPNQAAAFQLLTGWPQEDLLDPLSGTRLSGGRLFDRLEDAVRGNDEAVERHAVASVTLVKRALPERPPPRLLVLVGPSGVGRGPLLRRLVSEFPDKFGMTVSHTTRPPREHEAQGGDYYFMEVGGFREEAASGKLLEQAAVGSIRGTHLYGTSYATVREVAATGKLCLMGLDVQGVKALRANKRIDGMYVFVRPPSLDELERRQRGRLKEAESTIAKRLTWAAEEVARATTAAGVIDHVVDNGDDSDQVYYDVKEAISTLSPIIRNRLHGLPAYVLDYADLIAPNLVEKPFLKPVIIAGPNTGERWALMEQLVHEFPDVFAYPRFTTTKPHHEDALHRTDAAEHPPEQPPFEVVKTKDGEDLHVSRPTYTSVPTQEFAASAKQGAFLEHHTELFKHPLVARQWGVTQEAIKEVIRSGRLPLIECETEGAEMLKKRGVDCLTIFLKPPSVEVYEERLRVHLTETDEEIAARQEMARRELEAAGAPGNPFDAVLDADDEEASYEALKHLISRCRPDIIVPEEDKVEPPPPPKQPILVLCGPTAAGRAAMAKQLLSTFPDKFAAPGVTTDRKPAKGEVSTPALTFVAAKDLAKMAADGLVAYQRAGEDKASGMMAVTNQALLRVAAENKVAVLELPDYTAALPGLREGAVLKDALYVFVASRGELRAALAAGPVAAKEAPKSAKPGAKGAAAAPVDVDTALEELDKQAQEAASAPELYDAVVREDDMMDLISAVRLALAGHVPHIMPPPYRPLVVAGAFGTGKRKLLARLFDALPGRFAVPVISTTRVPGPEDPDQAREGMAVISREEADALSAAGGFATYREVLGEVYGITTTAIKKVGASGRVPIVEVDHVEDAAALRAAGFDAAYLFIGMDDMGKLLTVIHEELSANPPLGYELQDAVNQFFAAAKEEMAASRAEGLFNEWVLHTPDQPDPSFIRLAEAVHNHYPDVVTKHFVWGYGRQLWDPEVRVHGLRPLKVLVLGPAAAGKSTQCAMLSEHFGMPHINVGDLIFEEVRQRTPLGLEAKEYMDASKTVPDRYFFEVLKKRLAEAECVARGWVLDGFPHTGEQCGELVRLGIVPDKVVLLEGEHAMLLDRTRHRRYDPSTGRVYHLPEDEASALSPAIRPERPDGSLDSEVMARLAPRHDDSEENVTARLQLADAHVAALRDAFEDISLRLDSAADPRVTFQEALDYITLEARMPDLQVVPSPTLRELQYLVSTTLRYRRRQLLQLQQDDGRTFWVDAKEVMGSNAHCALLCQDPSIFPTSHQLRRVDTSKLSRVALLYVDSPEPVQLLASLFTGPQYPLLEDPPTPHSVLALAGPAGVGKSTVLRMLLEAYQGSQLALVPVCSSRPPLRRERCASVVLVPPSADGTGEVLAEGVSGLGPCARDALATACCMGRDALQAAADAGQLMAVCTGWDGHLYGVSKAALEAVWAEGRLPVVEGPLELALALKELSALAEEEAAEAAAHAAAGHRISSTGPGLGGAAGPGGLKAEASRMSNASAAGGPAPELPPVLSARVAYLSIDLTELDVRLRLQDQREEAELGRCLEAAQLEAAQLQRLALDAPAPPPPGAQLDPQWVAAQRQAAAAAAAGGAVAAGPARLPHPAVLDEVLLADSAVTAFHRVKRLAADSWRRPRAQVAGQLVLEAFEWRAARPGATVQRLRTFMSNAGLLELPRGRHVLRINSDSLFLHAVTFMSATACTVGEYSQVMQQCDASLSVAPMEGRYGEMAQGAMGLMFRYNISVPQPCSLSAYLSINGEDMRSVTRLLLLDRAAGVTRALPGNRLYATDLVPTHGSAPGHPAPGAPGAHAPQSGYCLLALADTSSRPVAEEGTYCLTVTSTAPLNGVISEVPCHRTDSFAEAYRPNARLVLSRHVVTATTACHLAAVAATEPRLPFRMILQEAVTGQEITWANSGAYPVHAQVASSTSGGGVVGAGAGAGGGEVQPSTATGVMGPEGYAVLPDTSLKQGKYLLTCVLDGGACPAGLQPDPVTGVMPHATPVTLRLSVHPSVDEKACTVVADNAHAKYVQGVYDKWNQAPVQLMAPPVPGGKGAKPAAPAGKGGGGARAGVAAGLLERYTAEQAAAGAGEGGNGGGGGAVTRQLKDGSMLALEAEQQLRVVRGEGGGLLTREQLEERQASVAAVAAAEGAARLAAVGKALEASKGERAGFKARQATNFSEWRAQLVRAQKEASAKRAEVMSNVKAAAAAAAAGANGVMEGMGAAAHHP